jgi:molecular chaperone DnaJ
MHFEEACAILGVETNASMTDIKHAYRTQVREWHPDRNPGKEGIHERFNAIQTAYEYVELVYAEQQRLQEQLGRVAPVTRPRLPLYTVERGSDVRVTIELSLYDAFNGSQRAISFDDYQQCGRCGASGNEPSGITVPCPYCPEGGVCAYCNDRRTVSDEPCMVCQGTGTELQRVTVRVAIPRSVRDGVELKTVGKGQWGLRGRGDLYVRVRVSHHPQLQRRDDDLLVDAPVTIFQAVFGGSVWLPGLDGNDYQITVPPGSSSGTQLVLEHKGFYRSDGSRGDICAVLLVIVPQTLSDRQRYLYEQLLEIEAQEALDDPAYE